MNYTISEFIKQLIKKKGYSKEKIAEEAQITVQGFYKWLAKSDEYWNINSLMILARILNFEVNIRGDEINIMENSNERNLNELKETYSMYKNFGDYSIVYIYTPNSNLNCDRPPEIMEDMFIFSSKENCLREFPDNNAIELYGLLDNKTNTLVLDSLIDIYPFKAESYYYLNLATPIEKTDDGYEVVCKFDKSNTKLVKAYAKIEIINGEISIKEYINHNKDGYYIGFALMNCDKTTSKDFRTWYETLDLAILGDENLSRYQLDRRYFDRQGNEIFEEDIIIKKGFEEGLEWLEEESKESEINKYFKKYESLRIEKIDNDLFFNIRGKLFNIEELNLMTWEKI